MSKPRLIYFDAPVSRGEECRLALHLAGIDFEDVRIKSADWPALKERTPYGGLPVLELPGRPALAHSNAILVLIGRRHGLHPADDVEAARHEGMMQHVEDLRAVVSPTLDVLHHPFVTGRLDVVGRVQPMATADRRQDRIGVRERRRPRQLEHRQTP